MGGSSKSSNSTNWSNGVEYTSPWAPQEPYIKQAFGRAEDAYNKNMQTGAYSGDYVAQGDARNNAAYQQAYDFGTDQTNLGYVQNMFNNANNWMNSGSGYMDAGAQGLQNLAGDQTGAIISSGNQYANNPYIGDAVKNAMIDANRNAAENDVPNLYRAAARSNALNSDRAALSQGVVERGLAERALGISGDMRYRSLESGLDRAANEIQNRRGAYQGLGALGSTMAGQGVEGIGQGIADQSRLNQMSAAGAEGLRSLRQDYLNNEMAKYEGKQNFPWQALQNFYSIVGDKSWGGTRAWSQAGGENKKETSDSGIASKIGGGLSSIGSLFSGGADSAARGLFSFL
jgi:hypothetical protein